MNILTQLLLRPLQSHVNDMLSPLNINESFPNTPRYIDNIVQLKMAIKRSESELWENNENVWPLRAHSLVTASQIEGKSISFCSFDRIGYRRIIETTIP